MLEMFYGTRYTQADRQWLWVGGYEKDVRLVPLELLLSVIELS